MLKELIITISKCRPRLTKVVIFWVLLMVTFNGIMFINSAYSLPLSPQEQPIPKLDFDDPAKSIVVALEFEKGPLPTDIENATLISVGFGSERARTHIGDPPSLKVILRDKDETFERIFNTWSPLWTFYYDQDGKEHLKIQQKANGTIVFPLDRHLGWMDLYSLPTTQLITRVNLTGAI